MKIGVLGPSVAAIDMTRRLLDLGASVSLFWPQNHPHDALKEFPKGVVVAGEWLRVTKRFLSAGVRPAGSSRFADLFRVCYSLDPVMQVEEGLAAQPGVFEKLTPEFLDSLKGKLEMFDDVDVVIDASGGRLGPFMGPGGPAVGEGRLPKNLSVPADAVTPQWGEGFSEIALVGETFEAEEALAKLRPWWTGHKDRRLFLINSEDAPFKNGGKEAQAFLAQAQLEAEAEIKDYEKAHAEWLEKDDFIRAKIPAPLRPIPRLVAFCGHAVTATDQLINGPRIFLTLETIPWVKATFQPENAELELKTIGVDAVVVGTPKALDPTAFAGLDVQFSPRGLEARAEDGTHPEVGFFTLGPELNPIRAQGIISRLKELFSPKGTSA